MYLLSVFTLNVLFISGFASGESSESSESFELDSIEFKTWFCDDENGTVASAMDVCFEEMNLQRFKDTIEECYTGVTEASGKNIYEWYCLNSDEAMDKADECAEGKIKDQEGEDIVELLKQEMVNCTAYKSGEEEYEEYNYLI
ncbi:hypothetical protein AVEN_48685-1 [Araneus ventricosus]|uniref:DUF19 domain-containing protein n=1 Tax=Araneus ventricosus TaxID=182803 RepID=A0A4Y2FXU7_ARAVE|nr:hypothetical protein AVEN_48685-1 [Araneus ventricosus]